MPMGDGAGLTSPPRRGGREKIGEVTSLRIDAHHRDIALKLGGGNLAAGIREALRRTALAAVPEPASRKGTREHVGRPKEGSLIPMALGEQERATALRLGEGKLAKGVRVALQLASTEAASKEGQ